MDYCIFHQRLQGKGRDLDIPDILRQIPFIADTATKPHFLNVNIIVNDL